MRTPFMNFGKTLALVGLISMATGCNEKEIEAWVPKLSELRKGALSNMERTPYKQEQHAALKDYFDKPAQLMTLLAEDSKLQGQLNQILAKKDLGQFCSSSLVSRKDWELIMWNCKVNNYFLCADEVTQYAWSVGKLREVLQPALQKKFDETPSCKEAL